MKRMNKMAVTGLVTLLMFSAMPLSFAQTTTASAAVPVMTQAVKPVKFLNMVKVTAIDGTSITATFKKTQTLTVDAGNAKIIRKYGAASSMEEMSVGDVLWVSGTRDSKTATTVTATKIRNMSVHKFLGLVTGKITAIGTGS